MNFCEGNKQSKIAIIGEAPGAEEARTGRPFVGASGQLLERLLLSVGISRSECYLTNVIKEHPPDNDITKFVNLNKSIFTDDYKRYEAELLDELRTCAANVLVPVGNVALYALTRKNHITKWRGSILESETLPGRKVIPTIHPAAALREYLTQHSIQHDLYRISSQMLFPEIRRPVRHLRIAPSYNDAMDYLQYAKSQKQLAGDIEVIGGTVACIGLCSVEQEGISIPFLEGGQEYFTPDRENYIWRELAGIFADVSIEKVFQNITFDWSFLFRKYGILFNNYQDTMIAHAVLFPDLRKGLDFITSVYTEESYYKDDGKMWKNAGVSYQDFWLYNAKDAAVTIESWQGLKSDLEAQGLWRTYRRSVEIIPSLIYASERGMRVNVDGLKAASQKAGEEIERLKKEFHALVDEDVSPKSPKQLKKYLTGKGVKLPVNRSSGKETTDEKALEMLAAQGHKEVNLVLEIRGLVKLKGTYYDTKLDTDNRLRCSFNPVTVSGRLSSSANIFGVGTNMQNLPRKDTTFRENVLADEGYLLFNIDLSQGENRVVAYCAPEPSMIAAFEAGIDIHRYTASLIFLKHPEDITKEERQWGKSANHGLNYGMGYIRFAREYRLQYGMAKQIVDGYHMAYPGIRQWHKAVQKQLSENRTLVSPEPFCSKRIFLDRWGTDLFMAAYDWIAQRTVADIINEWGLKYIYEHQELFAPVEILNQVHDSLVFQIPVSAGAAQIATIIVAIRDSLQQKLHYRGRDFSIPIDVSAGYTWGSAKKLEGDLESGIKKLIDENKDTNA